jgi:hypothetical protein
MKTMIIVLLACLLASCSSTTLIGSIGDTEFHGVKYNNFWGKTHTMVVVHDLKTNEVSPASTAIGSGLISDLLGVGGQIGSAYYWGHSLEPDEENKTSNVTVDGGGATATGGGANATSTQAQGQLQGQTSTSTSTNTNTNTNNPPPANGGANGNGGGNNGNGNGNGGAN